MIHKNKQAYLTGPIHTLSPGLVFHQYHGTTTAALVSVPASSFRSTLAHVETTGVVRGSSQSLFGVGQCEVCAAIAHL